MLLPNPSLATLEIDDVMRWSELKELVDEGSLEVAEIQSIFGECCSASAGGAMDVLGFAKFDKMSSSSSSKRNRAPSLKTASSTRSGLFPLEIPLPSTARTPHWMK